ncbi:cyclic lactone autoinducer peptide [Pseudobutyrivibrio sp. UC1225]|nr:cyclic lactone autoinducer peptide [Pseudobutyrivibrio sp. UC1225]SFO30146.1 cyclic lactone autoinducer peptide [Pseudobutyrivibrio sp. UC1225]
MKKEQVISKLNAQGKKVLVIVATHYANVTCPMMIYQPKLKESVKKLRKF